MTHTIDAAPLPILSIIIPTKNEEQYIENTLLQALKLNEYLATEIIVVDNGSTDQTFNIASDLANTAVKLPHVSISELRNHGASLANGCFFAFIDADVEITKEWRQDILQVAELLKEKPSTIYGARCHPPTKTKFLDRFWFNRLLEYKSNYINSGNLLTSKRLFLEIGGFDSNLITAEDHDFCERAKHLGADIIERRSLVALHHGYPSSIRGFITRERWHGRQDFTTLQKFIDSKVAMISAVNFLLFSVSTIFAILTTSLWWAFLYLSFLIALSISLTIFRYKTSSLQTTLATSAIFAIYITSRSLALLDQLAIKARFTRVDNA